MLSVMEYRYDPHIDVKLLPFHNCCAVFGTIGLTITKLLRTWSLHTMLTTAHQAATICLPLFTLLNKICAHWKKKMQSSSNVACFSTLKDKQVRQEIPSTHIPAKRWITIQHTDCLVWNIVTTTRPPGHRPTTTDISREKSGGKM